MDLRQKDLSELHSYVDRIDKEITMILQSLQWDRKHLLEGNSLLACKYDPKHKVPPDKKDLHEKECFLKRQGYSNEDEFLPDPVNRDAASVVKFCNNDIRQIINNAAQADTLFKKGAGYEENAPAPLTAGRLLVAYTADERRAIYDAAVAAAPTSQQILDLTLPGSSNEGAGGRPKSKMEVLAELRNMHRRRAKYRGPSAASKNYSHVLRDLIKTQMEIYEVPVEKESSASTSATASVDRARQQQHHDNKYNNNRNKHNGIEHLKTTRDENMYENSKDRYREGTGSRSGKEYNEYKEHRRREDKDRYRPAKHDDKYKRNIKGTSFKKEEHRHSSTDRKTKHIEDNRDKERWSEYKSSSYTNRRDNNEKKERTDKRFESSSNSSGKRSHRERESCEKYSEPKYKRYYDSLSESESSYENMKRKRHL